MTSANSEQSKAGVISFLNLKYAVDIKQGCFNSKEKVIIENVSGIFKPGLNAIMGPTGGGKTSLLDIIAGRKDPFGLKGGQLLIDGVPQPKNYKCISGYVVQDDLIMGTLTVKENLTFSANVRLPPDVSKAEKEQRVNEILQELGLTQCADTKIGTAYIRGVSGGERKRTNIGMELIISPSVLFLDEPTTGLDSSTSYVVLNMLKRLSRKGRTIVFSIHQPRYSIFKLFDRLMLLAKGKTIFHGEAKDALQYFSTIGYKCEEHDNPADFFLDVINGDVSPNAESQERRRSSHDSANIRNHSSHSDSVKRNTVVDSSQRAQTQENLAISLSEKFRSSTLNKGLMDEIQPIFTNYNTYKNSLTPKVADYSTTFFVQLWYVSVRALLNLVRNPVATVGQISMATILGVITGGLYFNLSDLVEPGIQNRFGFFFFLTMNQIFSNMSALEVFINERAIFVHENSSGFYRVSAFFIAKLFCDLIPMRIVPLTIIVCISYFMTGLTLEVDNFFLVWFTLLFVAVSGCAVVFCFGAFVGIFALANICCALTFIVMLIFGGLLVNIESLGSGVRWIQYASIFRYSLNGLSIIELKDKEFFNVVNGTKTSAGSAGEIFMERQGISYETEWDFWKNIVGLSCIMMFYLTFCYINLRRIKKFK